MTRNLFAAAGLMLALIAAPALSADAPRNTTPYPEEMKSSFVAGCIEGGMAKGTCDCFLRLIEPEWTAEEMSAFNEKITNEPNVAPPPIMLKIIRTCLANPGATALPN